MSRALRRQEIRLHGQPVSYYPFEEDPERFVRVLREFITMNEPSSYDEAEIRRRLLAGAPA